MGVDIHTLRYGDAVWWTDYMPGKRDYEGHTVLRRGTVASVTDERGPLIFVRHPMYTCPMPCDARDVYRTEAEALADDPDGEWKREDADGD